jgi:D-amino peptidase
MKILIAADMEGISGVTTWDQVDRSHPEYPRFRRLMTQDVNAAIRGAFAGGVDEVVVSDGHAISGNILIEELDPRARLISGTTRPYAMVEGIQDGMDAAFFIGYHARAGTLHAIMDHTWSARCVAGLWLNNRPTGEIGLNAALCGHFGAPVLLVSGDGAACSEASEFLGPVQTAAVKQAAGRHAALCLPLSESQALIQDRARQAVAQFLAGQRLTAQGPERYQVTVPVEVILALSNSAMTDNASLLPGAERLDATRICFSAADMPAAYLAFRAAVFLAGV